MPGRRALVLASLWPAAAGATYSICGTDMTTRQVGGSGASCVAPSTVYVIYGAAPGHGVVHAQAFYNETAKLEAVNRLYNDEHPADIIVAITDPAFDPAFDFRQYGIADLMGRAAGFTGALTTAYTEDRQGLTGAYTYSIQGNILTGVAVLDNAEDAFVNGGGCDLADRLMLALEGGAQGGQGDSRCTPMGIPANSAFIEVDLESDPVGPGSYLYLEVTDDTGGNPLTALRSMYDAWRATHPCPPPPDGGGAMDAGVDVGADLGADLGGPPDAGGMLDAGADVGPDMGAPPDTAAGPDVGGDLGLDSGPPADTGPAPDAGSPPDIGAPPDFDDDFDLGQTPDAGTPLPDVGQPDVATPEDAADAPASPEAEEATGCACRTGGAPAPAPPLWLLVALRLGRARRSEERRASRSDRPACRHSAA